MKKQIWKDYISFSKKERIALAVLALIIAVFVAFPLFYSEKKIPLVEDKKIAQQLTELQQKNENTTTSAHFVHIAGEEKRDKQLSPAKTFYPSYKKKNFNNVKPFDINTATVEVWKLLPGIGDVLANRIVNYRTKAGGFKSVEQVRKIYGLSDSVFQTIQPYLQLNASAIVQTPSKYSSTTDSSVSVNINTAWAKRLSSVPLITPDIAKAIVIYRQQHGPYKSLEELKKIIFIKEDLYQQIKPYLTL